MKYENIRSRFTHTVLYDSKTLTMLRIVHNSTFTTGAPQLVAPSASRNTISLTAALSSNNRLDKISLGCATTSRAPVSPKQWPHGLKVTIKHDMQMMLHAFLFGFVEPNSRQDVP